MAAHSFSKQAFNKFFCAKSFVWVGISDFRVNAVGNRFRVNRHQGMVALDQVSYRHESQEVHGAVY